LYNQERPHSSLDYRTPAEFAQLSKGLSSFADARTIEDRFAVGITNA